MRTQIFLALTQAGSHRSVNRLEHLLSFDAVSETPWEISQVDKGSGGVGKLPCRHVLLFHLPESGERAELREGRHRERVV